MPCPETQYIAISPCKENGYLTSKAGAYFKIILKLLKNKIFALTGRSYKKQRCIYSETQRLAFQGFFAFFFSSPVFCLCIDSHLVRGVHVHGGPWWLGQSKPLLLQNSKNYKIKSYCDWGRKQERPLSFVRFSLPSLPGWEFYSCCLKV